MPARERQPSLGLVYSPEDLAIQQSGGTWTSIIHPDGWTNRLPVLAWLGALELIALVTLPLTFMVFRPMSDRGYLFGKALGLLLVGLIVWLLASSQLVAFSRQSIVLALLLLGMASLGVLAVRWDEIIDFVRMRWRALVVAELIFIAAFLTFVLVRMANPDLWHPYRGGEKPMDFAYLNAVLRSTIMPPYDPWFGGGYMNYYYWGQFLTAMLIKATGVLPHDCVQSRRADILRADGWRRVHHRVQLSAVRVAPLGREHGYSEQRAEVVPYVNGTCRRGVCGRAGQFGRRDTGMAWLWQGAVRSAVR